MPSRQAQKSRPAARPRSARWKAWLCALTKPGSAKVSAIGATTLTGDGHASRRRAVPSDPERADPAALRGDPGLRRAVPRRGDGAAWAAGIVFGAAAITDQLDGWLARRWHVESAFGKVADPLADRLMIDVAVVLLWPDGRLPWPAAVIVLGRDLLLVVGYKLSYRAGTSSRSAPRQGRDLGPLLRARLRDRHREGHRVAARAVLDRRRARGRRGRAVPARGAPRSGEGRARAGEPVQKSQVEVDPFLGGCFNRASDERQPVEPFPISRRSPTRSSTGCSRSSGTRMRSRSAAASSTAGSTSFAPSVWPAQGPGEHGELPDPTRR